jgi:hypothetical protein
MRYPFKANIKVDYTQKFSPHDAVNTPLLILKTLQLMLAVTESLLVASIIKKHINRPYAQNADFFVADFGGICI